MATLCPDRKLRTLMLEEWRALHACILFAEAAHRGQLDKGGEPYIWHPLRVGMSLLPDVDAARIGLLHDVVEDTGATLSDAAPFLDHDTLLVAVLDCLTRRKGQETYPQYLDRLLEPAVTRPLAVNVKLADLRDNLDPRRLARISALHGIEAVAAAKARYLDARDRIEKNDTVSYTERR